MKHASLGFLAAVLLAATAARASDNDASGLTNVGTQVTYFFCRADYELGGNKFYFSRTQSVPAGVRVPDLVQSYQAFLMKNFGYPNTKSVSCPFRSGDSQGVAEGGRQQTIDNLHAANFQVVEIDWTYRPGDAAPANSSQPPAQPSRPPDR